MPEEVYWKTGTPWLGGWNYFLNMARVCNRFAPDIRFVLVNDGTLETRKRDDLAATGIELITAEPQRYWRGLLGRRDKDLERNLRAANIDVVFELITFHGARFGLPALNWIPDLQHCFLPAFFRRSERIKRNLDYWYRLHFRRHVMLSSEAARSDLAACFPRHAAQIHVVPFAVQPVLSVTHEGINAVRAAHGLSRPYFFLPNQFWQHKNHGAALEAVALAVRQDPEICLVLSGQTTDQRATDYAQTLLRRIGELGIERHVRVLGVISYSDLLHLIAGARALINPSLFEGWSTTVEEAKALGTPMLLSSLKVHREQAGDQAVFFDPHAPRELADALLAAWDASGVADGEIRRLRAAVWSLEAQRLYAEKLRRALTAALSAP
jgi:glycosyltransferase involved in cell wall biosynthesis